MTEKITFSRQVDNKGKPSIDIGDCMLTEEAAMKMMNGALQEGDHNLADALYQVLDPKAEVGKISSYTLPAPA